MLITKILTDPCAIRQNKEIKNTFADIVCSALVAKKLW